MAGEMKNRGLAFAATAVAIYAFGAFLSLHANPLDWPFEGRVCASLLWLIAPLYAAAYPGFAHD